MSFDYSELRTDNSQPPPSGRQYVPLLDFPSNVLPAFRSCNVGPLDQFSLQSEFGILDHTTEPPGYLAILEVKKPGLIINTICDLKKHREVLRLQVQLSIRAAKVEAQIRW